MVKLAIPKLGFRACLAINCKVELGYKIRIRPVQSPIQNYQHVQHNHNKQKQWALTTVNINKIFFKKCCFAKKESENGKIIRYIL